MGTSIERNKNRTRPKKSNGDRARRQRDQKKRLVDLGVDATVVAQLNAREVLDLLKRPAKIAKESASKKG